MPGLELDDLTLWYERLGRVDDGPRLLVFNGSGATIDTSRPLLDKLGEVADVLVHDQRCLGRTGIPTSAGERPPTMTDFAADAAALVDHVGWDRFAVFGISFGGMVAQEFAVIHPERITRLALMCTSPGGAGGSSYPLHELAGLDPDARSAAYLTLLDTRFDDEFLAAHPFDRMIVEGMQARNAVAKDPEVVRGERLQLAARREHDVWDRLERITCPTLVACGRTDGIAPMANSEAIASRIAGADLRRYEGGHMFVYQDRSAVPDVLEFLAAG